MISTCGRSACTRAVAARPRARASSAVRNSPATPRTPSVPNSLRAILSSSLQRDLALGELRALARLLQPGLLALLGARVTGQEAAPLELAAKVRVGLEQRAGDAVAKRAGLGGDAAPVQARDDIHAVLVAHRLQGLADVALKGRAGEVLLERAAVDEVGAGPRAQRDAGDRGLALARRAVARSRGEVDRDARDRLGDRLVPVGLAALRLLLALLLDGVRVDVLLALAERVDALGDDVDLEVRARHGRFLARRRLLVELLLALGDRLGLGVL